MSNVNSVSDIIQRVFNNIDVNQMDNAVQITAAWREILCTIQSRSKDSFGTQNNIGRKLADHTKIVDLKNEILIVETDHSGWIQTLHLYNTYILRGLRKNFPDLSIKSIAYRLKGSYSTNNAVHSVENKSLSHEEKQLLEKSETKNDLPEDLKKKFEHLKQSMLDKD